MPGMPMGPRVRLDPVQDDQEVISWNPMVTSARKMPFRRSVGRAMATPNSPATIPAEGKRQPEAQAEPVARMAAVYAPIP